MTSHPIHTAQAAARLESWAHLAQDHIAHDRLEAAAELYGRMLDLAPQNADLHHLLGLVLARLDDFQSACSRIHRAIALHPNNPIFYRSLGDVLDQLEDPAGARKAYLQCLTLNPIDADALLNLGNLINRLGDHAAALGIYHRILKIQPQHPKALLNIGKTFYDQGDIDAGLAYFTSSMQSDPAYAEAHFHRALALLTMEDYALGWPEYEWRFQRDESHRTYPYAFTVPRWIGRPFPAKRLLVHCEQGMGDVIQFARYLPMVKHLGGHVILQVHRPLEPLFKTNHLTHDVVAFDSRTPPAIDFDYYIPMLSLPLVLASGSQAIANQVPYIFADPSLVKLWQEKITAQGVRIGLVWQGSATDPRRACPLKQFGRLWQVTPAAFYSLQTGPGLDQLPDMQKHYKLIDLGACFRDFGDTAAAIAGLDLIITIDTAVAHLAGAMGKPVWIMLSKVPEWRWGLDAGTSAWYPTARLFRQDRTNDWSHPLAQIQAALAGFVCRLNRIDAHMPLSDNPAATEDACLTSDKAVSYFEQGSAYQRQQRLQEAVQAYEKASLLAPDMKEAHFNLGLIHHQWDHYDQAADHYRRAIDLNIDLPQAHNNLGVIYLQVHCHDKAQQCFQKALALDPGFAESWYNLGNLHLSLWALDQARDCFRNAIAIDPRHAKAQCNLGRTLHLLGFPQEALACYAFALEMRPDYAEAHFNRAITLLYLGRWTEAWPDYAWRFRCHDHKRTYPHALPGRPWQGEIFAGQTLLVHSEQGIGDALQWVRYLPMVKQRGGRVIVEARRSLMNLLRQLVDIDLLVELSAQSPPAPAYDAYIALGSLPALFQTQTHNVPASVPYLHADPLKVARWIARRTGRRMHVGLVWGGNDTYKERSCTLADLEPLADLKDIQWVSLQKGPAAAQAHGIGRFQQAGVMDWGHDLDDFSDTAAAVEALDLIISIDTAVAHLAGAMAKPVWILLPRVPDWRWLASGDTTPWYPTARLFRQARPGIWKEVIDALMDALGQNVNNSSAPRSSN